MIMPSDIRKNVFTLDEMSGMKVVYITDVEGNLDYFEHLVSTSKGLYRDNNRLLQLKENFHFVYGGDVCDRGKGDIRIATDLVSLAKRYPNNVHLILGNRDVNKMRLCREFESEQLLRKPSVYWVNDKDIIEPQRDSTMLPCGRADRLHTILECTMGAPEAFENRIQELSEIGQISDGMTSAEKDEIVVKSYLESVQPGGCMSEYLRLGTLAVLLGDTFFFHGGVHETALGWVPPSKLHRSGYFADTVQLWCSGLALFHHEEMTAFLASAYGQEKSYAPFSEVGGYEHQDPGSRLMQYSMGSLPQGKLNRTICYDSFLAQGSPEKPDEAVRTFLNRSGVIRTVTGHQPHGDAPLVITTPTLQVITGDTSYAQNVEWDLEYTGDCTALYEQLKRQMLVGPSEQGAACQAGTRGNSIAEIVIFFNSETSEILIHGITQAHLMYEFTANEFIGRCTVDGWWVKTLLQLDKKNVYMISKSEGRNVLNSLISESDLETRLM